MSRLLSATIATLRDALNELVRDLLWLTVTVRRSSAKRRVPPGRTFAGLSSINYSVLLLLNLEVVHHFIDAVYL